MVNSRLESSLGVTTATSAATATGSAVTVTATVTGIASSVAKTGMSIGAAAGIGAGVGVPLAILSAAMAILWMHERRRRKGSERNLSEKHGMDAGNDTGGDPAASAYGYQDSKYQAPAYSRHEMDGFSPQELGESRHVPELPTNYPK